MYFGRNLRYFGVVWVFYVVLVFARLVCLCCGFATACNVVLVFLCCLVVVSVYFGVFLLNWCILYFGVFWGFVDWFA